MKKTLYKTGPIKFMYNDLKDLYLYTQTHDLIKYKKYMSFSLKKFDMQISCKIKQLHYNFFKKIYVHLSFFKFLCCNFFKKNYFFSQNGNFYRFYM